jgi:2-methylisocitrate lyase-like PEP mutase family enzyme
MYLTGRGGLAALGMTLRDLGELGYKIVADPSTPLWAAHAAWKQVYAELAQDFGSRAPKSDWAAVEHEVLGVIDIERLLAVERATVEKGRA